MSQPRTARPAIRIEDPQDPRLALYAGVAEPRLLLDRGLLMAEGRFVVRRLLQSERISVRSLLLNEAAFRSLGDLIPNGVDANHRAVPDRTDTGFDVYVASPDVITAATGFNMHRGCLAVAERPAEPLMETLLPTSAFVVVLERVVDADNVGSVFRSAEAFGVDVMLLSPGCCDPLYRKAIRTSSGAALAVPFAAAAPWPEALGRLRAAGFVIVALTPDDAAMDIGAFVGTAAVEGRIALLLGTEGHGLTAEALADAHVRVRIPMRGRRLGTGDALDSLNIATAAGIALHRLHETRHRQR